MMAPEDDGAASLELAEDDREEGKWDKWGELAAICGVALVLLGWAAWRYAPTSNAKETNQKGHRTTSK